MVVSQSQSRSSIGPKVDCNLLEQEWACINNRSPTSAVDAASHFTEIVDQVARYKVELDQIFLDIQDVCKNGEATFEEEKAKLRIERGDRSFIIATELRSILKKLTYEGAEQSSIGSALCKITEHLSRRAFRYNRESPGFSEGGSFGIMPIAHTRNFFRDNHEHMFFLPLHPLPTAYDFFCCTFVKTPIDYRQELHLHRSSSELTLVLDGEATCEWYKRSSTGSPELSGSVSAGPLKAFRIPAGVIHTISNPSTDNANLSVKLSVFIEDRVGEKDWEFEDESAVSSSVIVDHGLEEKKEWGSKYSYHHAYQNLEFIYRVFKLDVNQAFKIPVTTHSASRFYFLFNGEIEIEASSSCKHEHEFQNKRAHGGEIIRLYPDIDYEIKNCGSVQALIFSVDGLDYQDFLNHPEDYLGYQKWLADELKACPGWK